MRRSWMGLGLLLVLLVLGAVISHRMTALHLPLSSRLEQAAVFVSGEDWERAVELVEETRTAWENHHTFSASFTDHTPMEEVEAHFAQLEIYRRLRDSVGYAALCAEMACQLEAISEAQRLTLKNLF